MLSKRMAVWSILMVLAMGILLVAQPADAAQKIYKWRLSACLPAGIPLYKYGPVALSKKVAELSNGRLQIQVLPAGAIAPAFEGTDAVRKGIADMAFNWAGLDIGRDPTGVLFGGYPGSMESVPMLHWLYVGGGAKLWKEWRLKKFNVVAFPLTIRPSEIFAHSHKPIRSLDDFKGLKMRTVGAWAKILKELGASPVSLPGAEIFPSLERKVIDATEWASPGENVVMGFHEIAKYIIVPGVHQPCAPFELEINKDKWESLPKDLQVIIQKTARLVTFEAWLQMGELDMHALGVFKKKGNEIIVLNPKTQKKVHFLGKKWAESKAAGNPMFRKVLDSQNKFEKEWALVGQSRHFTIEAD